MTATAANVLYVTSDEALLRREHDTVVVAIDGERKAQVPFLHLEGVALFGRAIATPELLGALCEAGVHVSYFTSNGRFLARVEGLPGGSVTLRRAQHAAAADPARTLSLAASFVVGKAANTRRQLRRASREANDEGAADRLAEAADHVARVAASILRAPSLEELRGTEGAIAQSYFGAFPAMLKTDEPEMRFGGRTRRPPRDPVNAMLSFGYALLMRDCVSALAGTGLDPALGFLHDDRPGRLSLALDLMEELRVPVVDRLVLAMINRNQLEPAQFREEPNGGFRLSDDGRKTFLVEYQKAKQANVHHVFLDQGTTWGMVPHWQARLLARALRGDLDAYPPFELR